MAARMRSLKRLFSLTLLLALLAELALTPSPAFALPNQFDVVGPPGSQAFGTSITVLSNGNIVVTDPDFNGLTTTNAGAVTLINGHNGSLMGILFGTHDYDQVGSGGVKALPNGNYVVSSPAWNGNRGAASWCSGTSSTNGPVDDSHGLVGSSDGDQVGSGGIVVLPDGNYLVVSPKWSDPVASVTHVGAVTWGDGMSGVNGSISPSNSLIGSHTDDNVGSDGVTVLNNNIYVVRSLQWRNGTIVHAGAVTAIDGPTGAVVSPDNSLVGSQTNDYVGNQGVVALANGNFVVVSPNWNNGLLASAGAVTLVTTTTGTSGEVTSSNSLVGSYANARVGSSGVKALANGNYVVTNPYLDFYLTPAAGAVTWGSGTSGITGAISAANSLVGSQSGDNVGIDGVTALPNGNYVVVSSLWSASVYQAGAVTWGDGTTGTIGVVSAANSLVGSRYADFVGYGGVKVLANGNYVVISHVWHNGTITSAGAVTWGSGTAGVSGLISAANSLVGTQANDAVGYPGVTTLTNGNYVVVSKIWNNGGIGAAGAATWCNGTTGTIGAVSVSNSLVGSQANDHVGWDGVTGLANGNYVVLSSIWKNGAVSQAGAATWGDGAVGTTGVVSPANSLVGSQTDDQVGFHGAVVLTNGNYVVVAPFWNNGGVSGAGAVTWGNGAAGTTGVVSPANSLVGTQANDEVGLDRVTVLPDGSFVVGSRNWKNDTHATVGAVTWGNGTAPLTGAVSPSNSLVGNQTGDSVGSIVTAGPGGLFIVHISSFDNGGDANTGAISLGSATTVGPVSAANSVLGNAPGGGVHLKVAYNSVLGYLVVGRPWDNLVTLYPIMFSRIYMPMVNK